MLIKKNLLNIPIPTCPRKNRDRDLANVQIADGILNINIFTPDKGLKYRFFCDGKNGIVYHAKTKKWSMNNIEDYQYGQGHAVLTDTEQERIKEVYPEFCSYYYTAEQMINGFFSQKNREKRYQYEKRKYDRMKQQLKTIPEPPKDLGRFCSKYLLKRYSILFPKQKNKKYLLRCLHCGTESETEIPPPHKGEWVCPHCKSKTTIYKKAYSTAIYDTVPVWLFRRIKNKDIEVLQFLLVTRRYSKELEPMYYRDYNYVEYKTPEKTYRYKWTTCAYYNDWNDTKREHGRQGHLYTRNLKALYPEGLHGLNLTRLKGKGKYDIQALLRNAEKYDAAKQLYKIGCFRLAEQTDALKNPQKTTFNEVTGVSNNYKTFFRKYDYGCDMAHKLSEIPIQLNEEQIKKLSSISLFKGDIKKLLGYMTPQKMINYFYKQAQRYTEKYYLTDLYTDYIGMVQQLNEHLDQKIDLSATINRYPKDIKKAHDKISQELNLMISREGDHILEVLAEKYEQRIPFSDQSLTVVYPASTEDFVQEGAQLHHCVGSYSAYKEKQIAEKWLTVFIRKRSQIQESYYTATFYMIENEIKLKECHGLHNKSATDAVNNFLEKYRVWVNKTIKEQKEAA